MILLLVPTSFQRALLTDGFPVIQPGDFED